MEDYTGNLFPLPDLLQNLSQALAAAGLSQKDPRLNNMMKTIADIKDQCAGDPQFWIANKFCCDEDIFKG